MAAASVNASSGRQVLQTVGGYFRPASAYPIVAGLAVSVLQGAGSGQWRTIVRATNLSSAPNGAFLLELDSPFTLPLSELGKPNESIIAINGLKEKYIFEGNEWVNGTTVQTYGNSNDWVLSGNVLRNFWTAGMSLWGIGEEDGDGGYQGSLRTLVERSQILCSGQVSMPEKRSTPSEENSMHVPP